MCRRCLSKKYLSNLPSVSVIIVFNNEHLSIVLRTCYSVINRSPSNLLNEIVLVDDNSDIEDLGQKLEQYVANYLPKVRLIRLPARVGLIKARLAGARAAISDVLLFLDAHCEANTNWLPPLLGRCYSLISCTQIEEIKDCVYLEIFFH